ncbi:uncharacterized protein TNCV_1249361 [Trichonephila clavipes]|nr:uncharacterized protein TNCV_1249361 [Trichonephila clavipes]
MLIGAHKATQPKPRTVERNMGGTVVIPRKSPAVTIDALNDRRAFRVKSWSPQLSYPFVLHHRSHTGVGGALDWTICPCSALLSSPYLEVFLLTTLTAVPLGLGSNPGEDMDVCKCILPSRHGRRAARPLVRLMEGEDRWEAPDHPRVFFLKIGVNQTKPFCYLYGAQSYG